MELHVGKLVEIDYKACGFESIESWAKKKCKEQGIIYDPYLHKTYIDTFINSEENNKNYFVYNDKIFRIIDESFSDSDIFKVKENETKDIEYIIRFDNEKSNFNDFLYKAVSDIEKARPKYIKAILYETDGYSDKKIKTVDIPVIFIKDMIGNYKYNIKLTEDGIEYIKGFCDSRYDGGRYYRLRIY